MIIRKANINDAKWIFEIRNNSDIRKLSNNNKELNFKEHLNWLSIKINNINKNITKDIFLVLELEKKIIWYIRLDYIIEKKYLLSIAILKEWQWKWYWHKLFKESLKFLKKWNIIIAEIIKKNINSKIFFEKLWFSLEKEDKEKFIYKYIFND